MAEYKDLSTIFHMSASPNREAEVATLLEERRDSPSTFDLNFETQAGQLFIAVPRELSALTQKVLRRERKVSNLRQSLPGIAGNQVLRSLVVDEVVNSNSIENVHSTRRQIEEALRSSGKNDSKFKRFREFANLYMNLMYGAYSLPENPEYIRAIYDKVMDGEKIEEPLDGELFRKSEVFISDGARQIHAGLMPESAIYEALESMIKIIESPDVPELYSALASHYIFEYIHPFYDGNGRMGRYLLSVCLEAPLSKPTALSLSRIIAENKSQYFKAFQTAENPLNHGELTFFVMDMLELILKAQDQLIEKLERNVSMLEMLAKKIDEIGETGEYGEKELQLIYALLQQKAFSVDSSMSLKEMAGYVGLGEQQTRKYMAGLERKGYAEKTRGRNPLMLALTDAFLRAYDIELDAKANA